jgi:hypothetical protein
MFYTILHPLQSLSFLDNTLRQDAGLASDRDDNRLGRAIIHPSVKRLQVEICTHIHQILDGYRVPVGFIIPHVKTH